MNSAAALPDDATAQASGCSALETLAAWRSSGAEGIDPVRFRFIEAFARRAAAHDGAVRGLLDARLAELLADYGDRVERRERAQSGSAQASTAAAGITGIEPPRKGPLAALLDASTAGGPTSGGLPELKSLRHFQATWNRLGARQRLRDARARAPSNAGPLNSQRLVHEALSLMENVAPAYLHRFVAYVDALSWIDRAAGGDLRITPRAGAVRPRG